VITIELDFFSLRFIFQIAVFLVIYLQARAGAVFSRKNRILIIPFFQVKTFAELLLELASEAWSD
jgi:hypothetical protein